MAAEQKSDCGVNTNSDSNTDEIGVKSSPSLENFVLENYEKQRNEGKMDPTEEISLDRTEQFFTRALQESRRMCDETAKSQKKSERLRNELGAERLLNWKTEHANQVLPPDQVQRVLGTGV